MGNLSTSNKLRKMDESADRVIAGWSFASLIANLAPPPLDIIAVGGAFARMGMKIANVYGVETSWDVVKKIGLSMAKGMGTVLGAAYVGSSLLKWVPGVGIWIALLVQPPIVGAVCYSAGHAFKQYFRICATGGRALTEEEMRELAETALREKLGL